MEQFKKIFGIVTNPWLILTFLAFVTLSYFCFDKAIAEFFYRLHLNQYIPGLVIFTELGKAFLYVVILGFTGLFFHFIRPNQKLEFKAWFLLLCVLVPNGLCLFLKVAFGRARPELWLHSQEYGFYWFKFSKMYWSFPSSHTCTIVGLLIGLAIVLPRLFLYVLIPFLLVIASRLFLYQHYLTDILVAAYLTFVVNGILVYCIREQKWFLKVR